METERSVPRTSDGYTLVEMLVTIIMFTLIVGSITTVVITTMKHQSSISDRGSALASIRSALDRVDRDIRSAQPLCTGQTYTHIAMLEQAPVTGAGTSYSTYIADWAITTVSGKTSLVYKQYNTTTTNNGGPGCTPSGSATTFYENTATATRTVLSNLVSATQVFTVPGASTFNNCNASPTDPSLSTTTAIQELTVTLSTKPSTLSSAVTTSDCGTYLRNYVVAVPTVTATA